MNHSVALEIARQGFLTGTMVVLPILAVTLFVGLAVSVFQAMTQVQEATLTFVPKLLMVGVVMAALGNWMLTRLVVFFEFCMRHASEVVR
ncbi:MAG: hypothetical protein AMXMBFR81_12010 [Chthonomonas sp.]|nr:flagellar biosynthetic protein FliQ [Fimbriimonadaceae bacterium]